MPTFTSCGGPCDKGRKLCPCPDACLRLSDSDSRHIGWGAFIPVFLALELVAASAALVLLLHGGPQ